MTVHRFIPAAPKHGPKTACGIKVETTGLWPDAARASLDGAPIYMTEKGKAFDCPRCRRVLELRHASR